MPISTVVTSMKDEAPYVLEWVAYHSSIGFDRIVVVANDCTDGTHEMLTRLADMGEISYHLNKVPLGGKPHSLALKKANQSPEVKTSDYVIALDADEFLVIKDAPHHIGSLIRVLEEHDAGMMVIPWRLYGSSKKFCFEDAPVIERFTLSMEGMSNPKTGVKTLFRQSDALRLAIHFPKKVMKKGKSTEGSDNIGWIDPDGHALNPATLTWNGGRNVIRRKKAEIAHFMIKSLDEYMLKIFRGDGLMNSSRHGIDYWSSADKNESADLNVLACAPNFANEFKRLRADPQLFDLHKRAVDNRMKRLAGILENPEASALRSILQRSTVKKITPEEISYSRSLVTALSPRKVQDNLLGENVPHSVLLNFSTMMLRDSSAIADRLANSCRSHAAMFWTAKDFDKRPITRLVEGLKRAQKSKRTFQVGCRHFNNFATAVSEDDWPVDESITVIFTRQRYNVLQGMPEYVEASREKYLEKKQRKFPPLKEVFKSATDAVDVAALIAAGKIEDPFTRLERFRVMHPDTITIDIDDAGDIDRKIGIIEAKGPAFVTIGTLLRDAIGEMPPSSSARLPASEATLPAPQLRAEAGKPAIRVHWFKRGKGNVAGNFGDELGPLIVAHITGRKTEWAEAEDCDVASIGSILSQVSKAAARAGRTKELLIWGSGLIEEDISSLHSSLKPLAVRGSRTRAALSLPQSLPLGDPGILSNLLVPEQTKKYRWGVVPHFSHRNSENIRKAVERSGSLFIDPTSPPLEVLEAIACCDGVVSSSLHGLIVSDSFSVPCIWLDIKSHKSHDYKFADYCSGVRRPDFNRIEAKDLEELLAKECTVDGFVIADDISRGISDALINAF